MSSSRVGGAQSPEQTRKGRGDRAGSDVPASQGAPRSELGRPPRFFPLVPQPQTQCARASGSPGIVSTSLSPDHLWAQRAITHWILPPRPPSPAGSSTSSCPSLCQSLIMRPPNLPASLTPSPGGRAPGEKPPTLYVAVIRPSGGDPLVPPRCSPHALPETPPPCAGLSPSVSSFMFLKLDRLSLVSLALANEHSFAFPNLNQKPRPLRTPPCHGPPGVRLPGAPGGLCPSWPRCHSRRGSSAVGGVSCSCPPSSHDTWHTTGAQQTDARSRAKAGAS